MLVFSCSVMSDSATPWTVTLPGSSVHGDSPGENTGVDCHALLQGIFPTQGSNPSLPHCRQILDRLSHKGASHMDTSHIGLGAQPTTVWLHPSCICKHPIAFSVGHILRYRGLGLERHHQPSAKTLENVFKVY